MIIRSKKHNSLLKTAALSFFFSLSLSSCGQVDNSEDTKLCKVSFYELYYVKIENTSELFDTQFGAPRFDCSVMVPEGSIFSDYKADFFRVLTPEKDAKNSLRTKYGIHGFYFDAESMTFDYYNPISDGYVIVQDVNLYYNVGSRK